MKNHQKQTLIVLSGDFPLGLNAQTIREKYDPIIAADGGAMKLREHGLVPDLIIGDLDSADLSLFEGVEQIEMTDQSYGDFEKCLEYLDKKKWHRVTVFGVSGGRSDHFLNNLSLITKYAETFDFTLFGAKEEIIYVKGQSKIKGSKGQQISLLPLGEVKSVVTNGLKWDLNKEDLSFGSKTSSSNECMESEFEVQHGGGHLFVFLNQKLNGN